VPVKKKIACCGQRRRSKQGKKNPGFYGKKTEKQEKKTAGKRKGRAYPFAETVQGKERKKRRPVKKKKEKKGGPGKKKEKNQGLHRNSAVRGERGTH